MNLRKELEIEAVPQAVEERLRRVYAELGEEVPQTYLGPKMEYNGEWQDVEPETVQRWPWLVRGTVAVCAAVMFVALAVFSSRLAGIELQPGMGLRSDTQTFTLGIASSGDLQTGQAAVTQNDSGYTLSVDRVYYEGAALYININIEPPEDAPGYFKFLPRCHAEDGTPLLMPRVILNGEDQGGKDVNLVYGLDENQTAIYDYTIIVFTNVEKGQEVEVSLEIDVLKAAMDEMQSFEDMDEIPVNFKADFTYQAPASGYSLTVNEASCDGEYLYLSWEIACPEEAKEYIRIVPYGEIVTGEDKGPWSPGTNLGIQNLKVLADNHQLAVSRYHCSENPEDGRLRYEYTFALNKDVEYGQELNVSLWMGRLYGITVESFYEGSDKYSDRQADKITLNLKSDFTVPVETGTVHISVPTGQDNGVSVLDVENTDELITLHLEVPVWGYTQEEMMYYGTILKGTYRDCRLYTESGQELRSRIDLVDEAEIRSSSKAGKGDKYAFTMVYEKSAATPNAELAGDLNKVILRVYEDTSAGLPIEGGSRGDAPWNVFAELTIDLEDGGALPVPTDTYLKEGMKKLDTQQYLNEYHTPNFRGGYYIDGVYAWEGADYTVDKNDWLVEVGESMEGGWKSSVQMLVDQEEMDFELQFFRGGERVDSIRVSTLEDYRHERKRDDGETFVYYAHDFGGKYFCISPTYTEQMEQMNFRTVPKWTIVAFVTGTDDNPPDKVQLVTGGDGGPDQVLIEDVKSGAMWSDVKCIVEEPAIGE